MAEYARNYYHLRSQSDPEYKKMLNEKQKINLIKRQHQTIIKPVGRPLKYPIKNYQFDPVSNSLLNI